MFFQTSKGPTLIGNIFSNFFASLQLFSVNKLMMYLSSALEAITTANVNEEVIVRGKACDGCSGLILCCYVTSFLEQQVAKSSLD